MLRRTFLDQSLKLNLGCPTYLPKRWSSRYKKLLLEKQSYTAKALSQFDDFYGSLFQEQWPSIRVALLSAEKKGIVVNNFSDKERVMKEIESQGAYNIRKVCEAQRKTLSESSGNQDLSVSDKIYQLEGRIEEALLRQKQADLERIYPEPLDSVTTDKITGNLIKRQVEQTLTQETDEGSVREDPTKDKPLAESLKSVDYDSSRLIFPGPTGLSLVASLYDYVPATKLKGMDDYIPESTHYRYYKDVPEAPIEIELEEEIEFPMCLDVYSFERGNCDTFKYSKKGSTERYDYHTFRLGMLAPIIALGMKKGDAVLDLTSSTLDIPMLISQTLIPAVFVLNCENSSRGRYMVRYLDSHMLDVDEEGSNVIVTNCHPLDVQDTDKYDKIIVHVPSTCDRRAVTDNNDNPFHPDRIKERIELPELQTKYLRKALELVKDGGTVIYCTETLSPIQNDAVVQRALEDLWMKSSTKFVVKDLSQGFETLQPFVKITSSGKFGHLVVPFLPNNCGPLYFSKLVKSVTETS